MAEGQDDSLQRIVVLMQAKDAEFKRAMDRNTMAMKRLSREGGNDMRKIRAEMKALDDQAKASIGVIGGWGKSFMGGMAGGIVTGLLAGITTNVADVVKGVAAIGDEAKRAGLGAEEFQKWKYVAEQNRVGIDALVDGFKELNLRADEFVVTGGGSAAEAFKRLGYSATDLQARLADPSALMLEIIGRLQQIDKAGQIRIMDELLGGTGGEQFVQLIGQGDEGLRRMMQRATETGAVFDAEMIRKAQELDQKFTAVSATLAAMWKTGIVGAAEFFGFVEAERERLVFDKDEAGRALGRGTAESLSELDEVDQGALAVIESTTAEIEALQTAATDLLPALNDAALMLRGMGREAESRAITDLAARLAEAVTQFEAGTITGEQYAEKLGKITAEAEKTFVGMSDLDQASLSGVIGQVSALLDWIKRLPAAVDAARREISQLTMMDTGVPLAVPENPADLLPPGQFAPKTSPRPTPRPMDGYEDWLDRRNGAGAGGGKSGGGGQDGYQQAVKSIREQTAALEAEAVALLATAQGGREYGDAIQYARRYADLLTAAQKEGRAVTPELRAEIDALAMAYVEAGEGAEAAKDKLEAVRESAKHGVDAMTSIFESMLDGSRSAKEALGDLLMEMAKVQLRQAAMGAFGGGGIASFLGGMLTPVAGARATGGGVRAGSAYLVNENTPNSEVFVPSQSGAVLTVAQAQAAMRDAQTRAVAPAAGRAGAAEVRVKVYVEDDGKLAAVASQAGAQAALPVAVEVVRQSNRQQAQAQRRK